MILQGNNLDHLREMEDNSVDAVVTDPPYGLGKEPDPMKVLPDWIDHGYHEVTGSGFMGKKWDAFVPQPIFWKEVFRVLKPGGHVVSFFGTRTYDWGVMAMGLAGFEIRDCLQWVYGSGFPKSHNVSKAIDKLKGAEREVIGYNEGTHPDIRRDKETGIEGYGGKMTGDKDRLRLPITTPEAQKYAGFGSALAPANEPIVLARKPLDGTIAENVLKWGTGGINVDGCRIGNEELKYTSTFKRMISKNIDSGYRPESMRGSGGEVKKTVSGRFPKNFLTDGSPEVMRVFAKAGESVSKAGGKGGNDPGMWSGKKQADRGGHNDSGSASRYFQHFPLTESDRFMYCPKAQSGERDCGVEGSNGHPCIKPVAIMLWLCKLITPPGGLIIDPFVGSGTTTVAAKLGGFQCIGMEKDPDNAKIAADREKNWRKFGDKPKKKTTNKKNSHPTLF